MCLRLFFVYITTKMPKYGNENYYDTVTKAIPGVLPPEYVQEVLFRYQRADYEMLQDEQ